MDSSGNGANENTNVIVNIRARPLNVRETNEGAQRCIEFYERDNQIKLYDKLFAFDNVFGVDCSQEEIFETCGVPLIHKFLQGFNCTILAYGQTGSGKTFTMGTEETDAPLQNQNRGMIPRFAEKLFEHIQNAKTPGSFKVLVSMLEIYQEDVVDLLSNGLKESLNIREAVGGVFVQGLSEAEVDSVADLMSALDKGCSTRSKGTTAMNASSSRSHAIFTVRLNKTAMTEDEIGFMAKFHLVDLAGSERLKKTLAVGERKKEGIKINEGLLALGNVISALADGQKHIPYRDSKITRILQDSLGGNSCTVMIACISPADTNIDETLSTLRYADRAKRIKNKAIVNADPQEKIIKDLRDEILKLRLELSQKSSSHDYEQEVIDSDTDSLVTKLREHVQKLEIELNEVRVQKMLLSGRALKAEGVYDFMMSNLRAALDTDDSIENKLDSVSKILGLQLDEKENEDMNVDAAVDDTALDPVTFAESAVTRHEKLAVEAEEVLALMREKERLLRATLPTEESLKKLEENHKTKISDLQRQLDDGVKEREELQQQLKKLSTSSKLAEDRRRRLNELEKEMRSRQVHMESLRSLQKAQEESKISAKKMRTEIDQLKQSRTKLLRQMKLESDKFRAWQAKQDRELQALKHKERKIEMQAARVKKELSDQLTIMKKKYKEAVMCKQQLQTQLLKSRKCNLNDNMSQDQFKKFISCEVDVLKTTHEVESAIAILLDDRRHLKMRLHDVQQQIAKAEEPASKRRRSAEDCAIEDDVDITTLRFAEEQLTAEINQCNEKISSMQRDIVEINVSDRADNIFAKIKNLSEARGAIHCLMDLIAIENRSALQRLADLKDVKATLTEHKKAKRSERREMERLQKELLQEKNDFIEQVTKTAGETLRACAVLAMENLKSAEFTEEKVQGLVDTMNAAKHSLDELAAATRASTSDIQLPEPLPAVRAARTKRPELYGNPVMEDISLYVQGTQTPPVKHKKNVNRKNQIKLSPIEKQNLYLKPIQNELASQPPTSTTCEPHNTTFVYEKEANRTFNLESSTQQENIMSKSILGSDKCRGRRMLNE